MLPRRGAAVLTRRDFLSWSGRGLLGLSLLQSTSLSQSTSLLLSSSARNQGRLSAGGEAAAGSGLPLLLFLAGDVMTGRGIDQVLPRSVDPELHEPFVTDARQYVELAEAENGEIPAPVTYDYLWGEALSVLGEMNPAVRIVNLETSVTTSDDWQRGKGIHYRMHPENVDALTVAGLDACVLGNNHVLDWGRAGLLETLSTLEEAGIATPGAGRDAAAAAAPAVLETGSGRILVFSYATPSAGVPLDWRATEDRPGVNVLPRLDAQQASRVADQVEAARGPGDRVVISIHWGGNWGYEVPQQQREFAHRLIDAGAADVVHGHSSHHPKGIEVYEERPILYGAGDLLNDYEGIGGRQEFRSEITLMYFPRLGPSGELASFEMTPMRVRRFSLERASDEEVRWLAERLDRESRRFGSRVELTNEGRLALRWG